MYLDYRALLMTMLMIAYSTQYVWQEGYGLLTNETDPNCIPLNLFFSPDHQDNLITTV